MNEEMPKVSEEISPDELIDRILAQKGRTVTAIAGAPAAGKSTLAEIVKNALNERKTASAAIFAMDGFHFDDRVLEARGHKARKGAPHTFDVGGYRHMLKRLRANDEEDVAVPVFDRDIEIARAGAAIIPRSVEHVITEGNYLLLNAAPWTELAQHFDRTVFVDVPRAILEERLFARWSNLSPDEQKRKVEQNDMPNVDLVLQASRDADFIVKESWN